MANKQQLELTWIGKDNRPKLELLIGKSGRLSFSEGNR